MFGHKTLLGVSPDKPQLMTGAPEAKPRVAEARAAWVVAGVLGVVLHHPWSVGVWLGIGIPWAAGMLLLTGRGTSTRLALVWREVLSGRAGMFGVIALAVATGFAGVVVSAGAGVLTGLWVAVGMSVIGLIGGPSTLRSQLAGWALLALSTSLLLLGIEAILRWSPVAERLGTPAEVNQWYARYDRLWERNVLGIRSPYETLQKDTGVVRIVVIGDSYTWGDKIASSDSTWPAQLEQQLRQRRPHARSEVINLARNGFTTVNGAEMLRRLGWQFEPDIVLVQFYLNDILPSGPDFVRHYSPWLFPRAWLLPQRYRHGPLGRSALLHTIEGTLTGLRHGDRAAQAETWAALYHERGAEWNALVDALSEMGRAAADRDVPIVLVLFPDFIPGMQEGVDPPFQSIHDQVTRAASAAGFSILDLTPHYLREGGDLRRWWATAYDAHPNEAANRFAAQKLADYLLDPVHPMVRARFDAVGRHGL
jgi:lysophospholipase L1-like esterase